MKRSRTEQVEQVEFTLATEAAQSEQRHMSNVITVFSHYPIYQIIAAFLNEKEATRLSCALRYCSFTSRASLVILYGHGLGKIEDIPSSRYDKNVKLMQHFIETQEVKMTAVPTSTAS